MSPKLSEWKKSLQGREGRKKRSLFWEPKSLGSRGNMFAKLKLKGIHEGQHQEPAAEFDPAWETAPSPDMDRIDQPKIIMLEMTHFGVADFIPLQYGL